LSEAERRTFLTVPPGVPFAEELHMQKMCGVVWFCTGTQEVADKLLAPARAFEPLQDQPEHPSGRLSGLEV
jgi:hypothetical protein